MKNTGLQVGWIGVFEFIVMLYFTGVELALGIVLALSVAAMQVFVALFPQGVDGVPNLSDHGDCPVLLSFALLLFIFLCFGGRQGLVVLELKSLPFIGPSALKEVEPPYCVLLLNQGSVLGGVLKGI